MTPDPNAQSKQYTSKPYAAGFLYQSSLQPLLPAQLSLHPVPAGPEPVRANPLWAIHHFRIMPLSELIMLSLTPHAMRTSSAGLGRPPARPGPLPCALLPALPPGVVGAPAAPAPAAVPPMAASSRSSRAFSSCSSTLAAGAGHGGTEMGGVGVQSFGEGKDAAVL